jgi:uncharacterized protein (TIGR03000 family)
MYSVVLMAALTGGGNAPELFFHHGCHGCYGCCGGCYGGCYGSCYGGCYGYGGGWGYGGGCWGCWGGYGCNGCWGGCYGCYGCYGGHGYSDYAPGGVGGTYAPGGVGAPGVAPGGDVLPRPKEEKDKDKDNNKESMAPNRARLIVELPADAKLYVDDRPVKASSPRRTFHTPELELGQAYYYDLRAEVVRDGKPVTETRRVIVRAGAVIRADFSALDTPVTTAKAR